MDEKEYTRLVSSRSRSYLVNIPKEITEKLGISEGSSITFKVLGDIITLHETNSTIPLDIVTKDAFDLTAKIRNLKKRELELEEDYIKDQFDDGKKTSAESVTNSLDDIKRTLKELDKELKRLKKKVEDTFRNLGESFSVPVLNELNDVFLLSRQLGGSDIKSDYDIAIEFIKNIVDRKRKYQDLLGKTELLMNGRKIPSDIALKIKSSFTEEINECKRILEKVLGLAKSA